MPDVLLQKNQLNSSPISYKELGATRDMSRGQIKKLYYKEMLKHHPDKNPPEKKAECEAKTKNLNEAWETLGDSDKRAAYDDKHPNHGKPSEKTASNDAKADTRTQMSR